MTLEELKTWEEEYKLKVSNIRYAIALGILKI